MKSSRAKEDMMRNLTTAHRSLSNLLNIYETSNIAIMDTKNSLESLRTFMISSNLNSNFDMDEETIDDLYISRKRKLNDDDTNPSERKRTKKLTTKDTFTHQNQPEQEKTF